jgi:hypothetical protein
LRNNYCIGCGIKFSMNNSERKVTESKEYKTPSVPCRYPDLDDHPPTIQTELVWVDEEKSADADAGPVSADGIPLMPPPLARSYRVRTITDLHDSNYGREFILRRIEE